MKPNIQLHDGENILLETQPRPPVVFYWMLTTFLRWILILVIFGFVFLNGQHGQSGMSPSLPHFAALPVLIVFVILIVLLYLWLEAARKKHWYIITSERCINFTGFFGINKQMVQFSNIVDINVRQNPLEKILGFSSVIIDSPGAMVTSRRSRGTIPILAQTNEDAEKIAHLIGQEMRNLKKQK